MSNSSLKKLENDLKHALTLIGCPPCSWVLPIKNTYDVVIIGGGMAGLAAAFALQKRGITHIKILDKAPTHREGPWLTYARMRTLRSGKSLPGPALDIAQLTFQAWYTAKHGDKMWKELYKIPNSDWMDYLSWYRKVLQLPVENDHRVTLIAPRKNHIALKVDCNGIHYTIKTQKVVLATGREGFGGYVYPSFVHSLPRSTYAHTCERIDFKALQGKRIGVIGVGASAFDAAAVALEMGCGHVDLLTRRLHVPRINKAIATLYDGYNSGYHLLSDRARLTLFSHLSQEGAPPPFESLNRLKPFSNVKIRRDIHIQNAVFKKGEILLDISKGLLQYDFLILATGFAIDGNQQPELKAIYDSILLWKDRKGYKHIGKHGLSPYLGPHYEFLEKNPGVAPYLKHIYCFNWAATLSHGLLSSDIPEISRGATRLAEGISADFFTERWQDYDQLLQDYHVLEFKEESYPF